jgi:hypothetical protein
MSDIKFVGEDIHVEGNVQRVTCFDIELDNAGRRKNASGRRRAFVHDFDDGLTLNWANDYPGGVTINGEVRMPNGATVGTLAGTALKCTHHTLHLDHAARRSTVRAAPAKGKGKAPSANLAVAAGAASSIGLAGHTVVNLPGLRPTQRRALMHDTADGLTINVNGDYPGGVTIRGTVKLPEALLVKNQDLLQLVVELQAKLAALEARVAVLEAAAPAPGD